MASDYCVRIRIIGPAAQGFLSCYDEQYVQEYDPARQILTVTPFEDEATVWTQQGAWDAWRSVDPNHPERDDGLPNRPLTAFTVEMEHID